MKEIDALKKLCPLMSQKDSEVFCVASKCMFWNKSSLNKNIDSNKKKETVYLYNGTSEEVEIGGNCKFRG